MLNLRFLGAARTTTGSLHCVEYDGHRVLLDCGLLQGHRKEAFEANRAMPFPAKEIDAIVLSHAHIDHSGRIPAFVKAGYRGPIYATPATRDLCDAMLRDSAYLQAKDVEDILLEIVTEALPGDFLHYLLKHDEIETAIEYIRSGSKCPWRFFFYVLNKTLRISLTILLNKSGDVLEECFQAG